jgi:peptidoglycan/LPS O-acetylase OafA/YrhL
MKELHESQQRDQLIDVLRGIAIILVLILHFHLSYPLLENNEWNVNFIMNGNLGVTIFFVISGYLISSNAIKRYGDLALINMKNFYFLRCARIIPPLGIALALISLFYFLNLKPFTNSVYLKDIDNPSLVLTILSVITFWHNIMMQHYGYFNYAINIYWSLSVEEFFYMVFPLVCLCIKKSKFIIYLLLIFVILSPIYRFLNRKDEIIFMYSYLACFDSIALGILVALFKNNKISLPNKKLFRLFGFCLMAYVYFLLGIHGFEAISFSLMALSAALVILSSDKRHFKTNILTRVFVFLGRISYELYLFHIIILGLIRSIVKPMTLSFSFTIMLFFIFIFFSILFSYFIEKYYSEPINKFCKKYLISSTRF